MRPWVILLTSAAFCVGCTHVKLEQRTINQASTLSDLQYRQVLDNLAMFLCNKGALPWHLRLAGGTVQVADQGFVSVMANTIHKAQVSPTLTAQRTGVGQWDVDPAVDADDLELLQLAYQKVVNPADLMIDRRIDEQICELCIRFDLLPNVNALKRLFTVEDAVTKIQEALDSVCVELEEIDKLEKPERPTVVTTRINEIIRLLGQPLPTLEQRRLMNELDRLNRIAKCLVGRSKDSLEAAVYFKNVRAQLVKQKLDLIRAWELVATEVLQQVEMREAEGAKAEGHGMAITIAPRIQSPMPDSTSSLPNLSPTPLAPFVITQLQPAAAKYLILLVMHLICNPGYTPPAANPDATRRNVGLIAQAEDKIQKLEQLIEGPEFKTPWFHFGGAKDVPKCACYVGHYFNCGCDMYVWVMPEQLEVLKEFTLVVLGLAPIDKQDILSGYPSGRGTAFSPAFTGVSR